MRLILYETTLVTFYYFISFENSSWSYFFF